jgi:hypothetical protein
LGFSGVVRNGLAVAFRLNANDINAPSAIAGFGVDREGFLALM